jgi:hypothetical protein
MVMLSRLNRDGCEPDAQGSEAARKAEIMADAGWLAQFGHIHHYLDFLVETAPTPVVVSMVAARTVFTSRGEIGFTEQNWHDLDTRPKDRSPSQ